MHDASALAISSPSGETIELRQVELGGNGVAWALTFFADAISLKRADARHGEPVVIARDEFFQRLEFREHVRCLVIRRPKRIGLRLGEADQLRLRAWLGPRSQAELEHVVKIHFPLGFYANAVLVALAVGWSDAFFLAFALGSLATSIAARFRPRAWQLLLNGILGLALAARSAWQLWHDQVHSKPLAAMVIAGCVFGAIPALAAYRRFMGSARTLDATRLRIS